MIHVSVKHNKEIFHFYHFKACAFSKLIIIDNKEDLLKGLAKKDMSENDNGRFEEIQPILRISTELERNGETKYLNISVRWLS